LNSPWPFLKFLFPYAVACFLYGVSLTHYVHHHLKHYPFASLQTVVSSHKVNFKKGQCLLRKRNEVKFNFIKKNEGIFPVKKLCEVMNVSRSGYYAWVNRPAKIISESELMLYRRTKALFRESRQSLV
jgi:hypothetical protein